MTQLLELLTENELKLVTTSTFSKDEIIFHENEKCDNFGILLSGSASIVSYSFGGKDILFRTLKKHDCFGENLIFSNDPIYRGNVISTSTTTVAFISKENLLLILQEHKNFLIEFLKLTSEFAKNLNSKIKILSFDNAQERFTYFMHINKNNYTMHNITDFASELGISRETLSRLLTKLENEEKIVILGKKITLID